MITVRNKKRLFSRKRYYCEHFPVLCWLKSSAVWNDLETRLIFSYISVLEHTVCFLAHFNCISQTLDTNNWCSIAACHKCLSTRVWFLVVEKTKTLQESEQLSVWWKTTVCCGAIFFFHFSNILCFFCLWNTWNQKIIYFLNAEALQNKKMVVAVFFMLRYLLSLSNL